MEPSDVQRRLAAILCADVVGYSRLMGDDEPATVQTLTEFREVFISYIQRHHGRVVDAKGDALMAEFVSVVDAVAGAVEVQRELAEKNAELPGHRRMDFRIGINLGDVVVKDDAIYGDGVNIAARMESLADPGGVCLSGKAYEEVKNKLPLEYEDQGLQTVKNIAEPVRVYRILSTPGSAAHRVVRAKRAATRSIRKWALIAGAALILVGAATGAWYVFISSDRTTSDVATEEGFPDANKPSIAVLPFVNMSGDPEQEYFADGISEDIITDLAKISGLFVVARNSSFTFKGVSVDVTEVGRKLGVRYILEGSVRKSGDRIRISAQLIDTTNGYHLWSERYDRELTDVFAMQDEITAEIISNLKIHVTMGESERIRRKTTESLEAWEYYRKGRELYWRFDFGTFHRAQEMFKKALEHDPEFAAAMVGLGHVYLNAAGFGWPTDVPDPLAQANDLAEQALNLDKTVAEPYDLLAYVHSSRGQYDRALAAAERAVAMEPNVADYQKTLADVRNLSGLHEEALVSMKKALRLSPVPPDAYLSLLGRIYYSVGSPEDAVPPLEEVYERTGWDTTAYLLIASYVSSGRIDQAKTLATRDPLFFNSYFFSKYNAFKHQTDLQRFLDDLATAGVE